MNSPTFECPIHTSHLRFTEISYLCSIRDVLGQWGIQLKSSYCQQLLWFPFSELTVMTHLNPTEKYNMVRKEFMAHGSVSVGFDYVGYDILYTFSRNNPC